MIPTIEVESGASPRNPFGKEFRQPKIEHLRLSALRHENIRRFDVAVDYSFGVRRIQSFRDLNPEFQRFFQWKRFPMDVTAQRFPVNEFHGDESPSVLLANVIDRANARMIQSRCGSRFAAKSLQHLRVLRHFLWQEFQSNGAGQPCVHGLIDHSHPTFP